MALLISMLLFLFANANTAYGIGFAYSGPSGPEFWGSLLPEWGMCSSGQSQSPINIVDKEAIKSNLKPREVDLLEVIVGQASLLLSGHDVGVEWTSAEGNYSLGEKVYKFDHLHFHSPSEHAIDGRRYPLEMHKVHVSSNGQISVIGVLFEYGEPDVFLNPIINKLKLNNPSDIDLGLLVLDVSKLGEHFYGYTGSLTTPPCTQGVTWTLMKKTRTVSVDQVLTIINAAAGENARPLKNLNARQIYSA